eukprot:TRINITY_DN292_c0_g2_i3.p1 TRINITY_DN292_c0_g2~~TRINITY_DN292_c0_g2_i3.p1  ORF type:complete len:328 (-),score=55.71 TRINITY_DN292_c0_g2_i3:543-1526(-)
MDIGLFRAGKGGNPDLVRESQRRRYASLEDVDKVIELDERWRKLRYESEVANKAFKDVSKEVGRLKQTNPNTDVTELIEKSNAFKEASLTAGRLESEVLQQRDELLYTIGNLVHHSVPVSKDEANNEVVRIWGENRPSTPDLKHHHELLYMIAGYEPKIGADVAGHRGYYLTGFGMLLNQALIQYAQRFLYKKGYQPVQTPFFMKQSTMKKVAALAEFHEALYKVEGDEEEPYYLIATSEQPICALNMGYAEEGFGSFRGKTFFTPTARLLMTKSCPSSIRDCLHVSARRPEVMDEMFGESFVFINLKKSNNLWFAVPTSPGMFMRN